MSGLYFFNVTVHVFAALLWLGGMFFFVAVGAPVLRQVEPAPLRMELFRRLGERFRRVGWAAVIVLVVTGTLNLWFRGVLHWDLLTSGDFWASPWGRALGWKLVAVSAMLALQAIHDFVVGPRTTSLPVGSPEVARYRRQAAWLGRLSGLIGIVLILAAVRLARGG